MEHQEHQAIIVWHYYKDGKIIDYLTSNFTGNIEELNDAVKNDGVRRTEKNIIAILHQVIIL